MKITNLRKIAVKIKSDWLSQYEKGLSSTGTFYF